MDRVLTATQPIVTGSVAVAVAARLFGMAAETAVELGSERDRAFALEDGAGRRVAILKVSNAQEDPEVLDMEAAAALHIAAGGWPPATSRPRRSSSTGC